MSGQNTNIAATSPSLPPSLSIPLSFLQWAKHMCGAAQRLRRKPQTAAAHASFYSALLLVFARAQHHFDKPHRSIAFNPTLCAPSGMSMLETTHSQFSSESKKNRTEKWSVMAPHGKPTLLHIGRPVQAQNHCSFYAICSQLTFLGQSVSKAIGPGAGFNGRANNLILILRHVQTTKK